MNNFFLFADGLRSKPLAPTGCSRKAVHMLRMFVRSAFVIERGPYSFFHFGKRIGISTCC